MFNTKAVVLSKSLARHTDVMLSTSSFCFLRRSAIKFREEITSF